MKNDNIHQLILLTSEYPFGNGETFLENEIDYLSDTFDKVLIISASNDKSNPRQTPANVEASYFDYATGFSDYLSCFSWSFLREFIANIIRHPLRNKVAIKSWVRANALKNHLLGKVDKPTTFYSYWLDDKAIALAQLKGSSKMLKAIARAHRWDIYEKEHLYSYLPFRSFLFNHLDSIESISSDGLKHLEKQGAKNVAISRLGVIQDHQASLSTKGNGLTLISISYLIKRKRIDLLIDSLRLIDKPEVNLTWIHFGNGPEMEVLKEQSNVLKNIQVLFKGFVQNKDLKSWLLANSENTVLINLSESEGIPVSMMEAMSFAVPCIGTKVGGVSEIINEGENGFLLQAKPSAKEVAEKIWNFYNLPNNRKNQMKEVAYNNWKLKYNAKTNFQAFCLKLAALN